MSKIIKNSNYVEPWIGVKLICKKCKCEWECEKDDVGRNYYEPDLLVARCPECYTSRSFAEHACYSMKDKPT